MADKEKHTVSGDKCFDTFLQCYFCTFRSTDTNKLVQHCVKHHISEKFSVRRLELDDKSGKMTLVSKHFPLPIRDLKKHISSGNKCIIDIDNLKIRFKRVQERDCDQQQDQHNEEQEESQQQGEDDRDQEHQTLTDEEINIFKAALDIIKTSGRRKDFVSVLEGIACGTILPNHISLHLLLDIGNFLSSEYTNRVRYNTVTLDFWSVVQKMFKGKATRFFRGSMSCEREQNSGAMRTSDCKINFAVPSQKVLAKHTIKHRVDAEKPGILHQALDAFASSHPNTDCKISIDGKKLSYGFGKHLGDEDLDGHEEKPTLKERQAKFREEVSVFDNIESLLSENDFQASITSIDKEKADKLKQHILICISNVSKSLRDLRTFVVKKKRALQLLLQKIEGDWKTNVLAGSISFLQTKLIQSKACINSLLESNDEFGYIMAQLNGTQDNYVRGTNTNVRLQNQGNYVCLRSMSDDIYNTLDTKKDSDLIKQHTPLWHDVRSQACVTGSTWNTALGMRGLKEQKLHYDRVFNHVTQEVSAELQQKFDYGSENEINGVATLVGKLIPVYYPNLVYKEDGCKIFDLKKSEKFAVSSGDGTGYNEETKTSEVAFEIKCPIPGKKHTTDVFYKLPHYYVVQVLAEMNTSYCKHFANVCYTPNSTTYITGDNNARVWEEIVALTQQLYCSEPRSKPSKLSPESLQLKDSLKEYAEGSQFVAEFPSLQGIPCDCQQIVVTDKSESMMKHNQENTNQFLSTIEDSLSVCYQAREKHAECYELLRKPAKEVLVAVISDIDRIRTQESHHALPIAYYMSGFSLKMDAVRAIINDIISACAERNLNVKAVAFDGQFLEVAITDDNGQPTTICKLQKQCWKEARQLSKKELCEKLIAMCEVGNAHVYIQHDIAKYMTERERCLTEENPNDEEDDSSDVILQHLPKEVIDALDTEGLDIIRSVSRKLTESVPQNEDIPVVPTAPVRNFEAALCALLIGPSADKFQSVSVEKFKEMLSDGPSILRNFTVDELKRILAGLGTGGLSGLRKNQLANIVSELLGDGEPIAVTHRKQSPPTLQSIIRKKLSGYKVLVLSIMYCNNIMLAKLQEWNERGMFKPGCDLYLEGKQESHIYQWYAQPHSVNKCVIQPIIDAHHIYVNNRAKVCAYGMPLIGINREAWIRVASKERENGTKLSMELVIELRDRQRNSFAETTFSSAVQAEMEKNGDTMEAKWCELIRDWYHAIDEAGIAVRERIACLLTMRKFLLSLYHPLHFPPPGNSVSGLPMAQFEGILTNIDRRIQLYHLTSNHSYNQRSISSLDSETFFSSFQDIDPKGSGVLKGDDVPHASSSASFIFEQRLRNDRPFQMKTCQTSVYKHTSLSSSTSADARELCSHHAGKNAIHICEHHFDRKDRMKLHPRRKAGYIQSAVKPAKGAQGVRAFHKVNEEKILPHRRAGYTDDDCEVLV